MNKEKILESSRRENKNRDLAEMEVTAQAVNIAGRVGAAACVVLTLIFRIFTKTYFCCPLTGVTTLAGDTRLVLQAPAGFSIGV